MGYRQTAELFGLFCARTFIAALIIVLLLGMPGQSQPSAAETKRVLMLHSFGLRFKPWTDHARIARYLHNIQMCLY